MIGVLGAGAWGTALAQVLASDGSPVILWAYEPDVVAAINESHENPVYLAGRMLSPKVFATGDIRALGQCDAVLVVPPAQHLRGLLAQVPGRAPRILCAKGIEAGSGMLMSEVAEAVSGDAPIAVLSGPTFAHEVAAGLPTAVTLACEDAGLREALSQRIAAPHFRPYATDDVTGAEFGGAIKNVLAIGCGVVEGAGLGQNARASVIARATSPTSRRVPASIPLEHRTSGLDPTGIVASTVPTAWAGVTTSSASISAIAAGSLTASILGDSAMFGR